MPSRGVATRGMWGVSRGFGGFSVWLGALGARAHLVVTAVLAQGPETTTRGAIGKPWTTLWHLVASNRENRELLLGDFPCLKIVKIEPFLAKLAKFARNG